MSKEETLAVLPAIVPPCNRQSQQLQNPFWEAPPPEWDL
jgi:hypothetical protein